MELLIRWASSQPLQHAQWGVVFHRTLDKFCHSMPGWGVQERSGRSTITPLLGRNQRQSLQRANARGAMGILVS